MAFSRSEIVGRVLYGALFVAVLPAGLAVWARATEAVVGLPVLRSVGGGMVLTVVGLALMLSAFHSLWKHGGGLPMNAYPPPRYVHRGVYGLLSHPIYVGFVILCGGVSLIAGSASGLWLVTPAVALGSLALVLGYEGPSLRRRFGDQIRLPWFHLPLATDGSPSLSDRVSVYVLVLLPWLLAYEAVQYIGVPVDALPSHLPMELDWPVWQWTTGVYSSVYVLVMATPLVAATGRVLRRFCVAGLLATAVVTVIYLVLPVVAPPRPFEPTTLLGRLLALEQGFNHTVAAFPAFHVLWALFAAAAWSGRLRFPAYLWALAISATCITTGMHSLADVAAAFVLFPVFHRYDAVWELLRRWAERVANAWREWHVGPVRTLNHGIFGGLSMAVGVMVTGVVVGPGFMPGGAFGSILGLVGAAAWAQTLEGSSALLRPFGYYGSVLGVMAGVGIAEIVTGNGWILLGGFAVAAPWIQAIGRLRCLIQGCCHGGPAPGNVGIRYLHSRSRVTRLSGLGGVPVYPTPLFSILGNVLIGVLLLRLWSLSVPPTFVAGIYLLLAGLARFMEESYRAEPQTKLIGPLHIYHWFAIASVVVGALLTGLDSAPPEGWLHVPTPGVLILSLGMGLAAGFAMGVDFPASNRRFSRLAEVEDAPRILTREELGSATSGGEIVAE